MVINGSTRHGPRPDEGRFTPEVMYSAASLYYLQDATQADIAEQLGTSRATVSRILAEARRQGLVRIDVTGDGTDLATRTAVALGLRAVHLAPNTVRAVAAAALAPALSMALARAQLHPGETLLVSSGRTIYETAQAHLPNLPGVLVAPTVGGLDEPEAWYQTNEIVRQVAAKIGGTPVFLYAPALPGADLYERLVLDHSTQRVLELWRTARCALLAIGAPPPLRTSLPAFVPGDSFPGGGAATGHTPRNPEKGSGDHRGRRRPRTDPRHSRRCPRRLFPRAGHRHPHCVRAAGSR